ncbi:regulatory iron-sulfur-containing complex subunit RicT [Vicingaceae bacterium]|nr:regulatory iron-sulfur-containing complex subunit RicT [Vicingaceae bacterium]MDB4061345.1 regulatory iron-sulfur-containing complex subunit RicT [Vicingaceae bacterium]MDC1451946.1 regulatory iron-sulfur-containing complex subunit RicT [Vicingaceae bacterium]
MGCATCSNKIDGVPNGCKSNGSCGNGGCSKLTTFNWLANMALPANTEIFNCVEVRFKNGRKEFFINADQFSLYEGDIVKVEATTGYDVGVVCLTGELVRLQMQKKNIFLQKADLKKVHRKSNENDVDKWLEGRAKENEAMLNARAVANELSLKMKISDVEYQGDLSKAVFYYTADERVDFRDLIRILADTFNVRIEMKQIGARQEAGRLGGIGSCGRELCCSTWLTDFRSVSTSAARYQQLSLNPTKLAGQCGKLKCCLNFELDTYVDELKKFPDTKLKLKTKKGNAFFQKMDIFANKMWYSYQDEPYEFIEMTLDRVKEVISINKKEEKVDSLKDFSTVLVEAKPDYENVVGQDDLTRFDKQMKQKKRRPKKKSGNKPAQANASKRENKAQANNNRPAQSINNQNSGESKDGAAKKKSFKNRRPNNRNNPNKEANNKPTE